MESGAGSKAGFTDDLYEEAGASVVPASGVWSADIVIKLNPPSVDKVGALKDRTLISLINPQKNEDLLTKLQSQGATCFALDCIPMICI